MPTFAECLKACPFLSGGCLAAALLLMTLVWSRRHLKSASRSQPRTDAANHRQIENQERSLRNITANLPGVVYQFYADAAGNYGLQFVSDKALEIFGLEPKADRFYGVFTDGITEEDRPRFIQSIADAVKTASPWCYEGRFVRPSGETIWFSGKSLPREEEGRTVFDGVLIDITKIKQSGEEILTCQTYLESVLYHAPDAIITLDASHRVLDWNPGAFRMFGYTREETIGRELDSLVAQNVFREEAGEKTRQVLSGQRVESFETVRFRKDGTPLHVIAAGSPIQIGDRLAGVVAVYTDITALKQVEGEIRQSKNMLELIINSMPSILVGVDSAGQVTQWNTAAERATQIPSDRALGRPLYLVLPAFKVHIEKIKTAMETGAIQSETKVARRVDSEIRFEDITVYPLWQNGEVGAVIRVDDVTARVRIEEMMVQSEKMLSVGGLAAGMAHEINNPLAVILQNAQNVERRLSPDLPANVQTAAACGIRLDALQEYIVRRDIRTFLEDIRTSGERAAEIVTNMLNFSRKPDQGGSSIRLSELLDRTVALAASDYDLKKKYDFRQIRIVREYDPDTPMVTCQSSMIQQVFFNILHNGAEAMHASRSLERDPSFILRVFPEGGMVRVDIADTGPGMDEATRKRVFEPFFTTKPAGIGTGLGLSVSYFIVTENHKGTLSVESTPGEGTRFIIRLPATPASGSAS